MNPGPTRRRITGGTEQVDGARQAGGLGPSPRFGLHGADRGLFSIDGGVLSFKSPPDFDAPADSDGDNDHQVAVEVTDGVHTIRLDVTVTVTDVGERRRPPVFISGPAGGGEPAEPLDASAIFGDVEDGAYYEPAVAWMIREGITAGCAPRRFCPEAPGTRQQFVTFLWR